MLNAGRLRVARTRAIVALALVGAAGCFGGGHSGGSAGSGGAGSGGAGAHGGSGGSGTGATVDDFGGIEPAIEAATNDDVTESLALQGDGAGARYDLLLAGGVPAADALIAAGEAAIDPLVAELAKSSAFERDDALTVVAFVLGKIGSTRALDPLADFLQDALDVEFPLHAANAATDAVFEILETTGHGPTPSARKATYWYTLSEIQRAIDLARVWASIGVIEEALTFRSGQCRMRYVFLDASGNVIQCPGADGSQKACVAEGVVFEDVTKVSPSSVSLHDEAKANGAVFPPEFDGGAASRRFNCAGYAFREINRYTSWTASAPDMQTTLVAAGLLRKKSGDPQPGDKVFFRPPTGWKFWDKQAPAHVAEVDRIEDGKPILRAPDNFSGIFDLALDAPYWNDVRSWTYDVYEWVNGPPKAIPDPDFTSNPAYCGDPFTDHCPNTKCEVDLHETSDNCPQDCRTDDGTCDPFEKMKFDMDPNFPWTEDCGICGDDYCDGDTESAMNCEKDCGTCGNGVCNEVMPDDDPKNECHLDEVNGMRCPEDCCTGGMTTCSHMAHSFCQGI